MHKKRVLMISVSAGSGHVRAAEALLETSALFEQMEARHIDVMTHVGRVFRGVYSDLYRHLINHAPVIWSYLYKKTDQARSSDVSTILRRLIERICTRKLIEKIVEFNPDQIICTHFMPAELLIREIQQGRLDCPVWVQVTDFDLHSLWVQPQVHGYFAANEEVAFKLRERGVAAERIYVTGIPVAPVFLASKNRQVCRSALGLRVEPVTVLILSGGARIGSVVDIAARLLKKYPELQVIAIAGSHAQRLADLKQLALGYPGRLVVLGFSRCIENLMAASDLVVTKPGGLTSAECLIMGLPMLLVDPIPGQEERNGDYLLEHGAGLKAQDMAGLDFRVGQLLANPDRLAVMRNQMQLIARPDAANAVLTKMMEH